MVADTQTPSSRQGVVLRGGDPSCPLVHLSPRSVPLSLIAECRPGTDRTASAELQRSARAEADDMFPFSAQTKTGLRT